jgi:hypothetical protein
MQQTNYVSLVNAINCYDDEVLEEARKLVMVMAGETVNGYSWDYLWDVLNEDFDLIGEGDCWQRTEIRDAMEAWAAERCTNAIHSLVIAMLKRSVAWERTFT